MGSADSLLARVAELLGCKGHFLASEVVNYELLSALAAGELEGLLACLVSMDAEGPTPLAAPAPSSTTAGSKERGSRTLTRSTEADGSQQGAAAEAAGNTSSATQAAVQVAEQARPEPPDSEAAHKSAEEQPAHQSAEHSPHTSCSSRSSSRLNRLEPTECTLSLHTPGALPPRLAGCPAVYLARPAACSGSSCGLAPGEEATAQVSATLLPDGPSLSSLHLLLQHVVAPWLAAHQPGSSPSDGPTPAGLEPQTCSSAQSTGHERPGSTTALTGDSRSAAPVPVVALPAAAELLAATTRLAGLVAAAAKHLRSEVVVRLPSGVDLTDVAAAAADEEAVLACEQCVEEWVLLTTSALQREAAVQPGLHGPLAELELWQARAEAYGGLLEQLSVPAVQAVAEILQRGSSDAALAATFRAQLAELARLALDARDNSRFLATLERHFRALANGSLAAVADAVEPMLNALRMIWVISRHYGDDLHMSNLLERIARCIQERLDAALDVATLFSAPAAESLELVRTCLAVARGWQAHYMAQREKIEASGHPARWEFSRELLFKRTNHIAEVCADLEDMLSAVDDFRQFLGPELRTVMGSASVIEEVSVMVSAMVEPVEVAAFNPFDPAHSADWHALRQRFARDADDVEMATRDLIDSCFRGLRSVDAAVQLLHSFQRIHTQGAVQQQMADKLAAVLEHFISEIAMVRRMFEEGREKPPLGRNMPPVAGAIKWCRSLLVRVRSTWAGLQALGTQLEALDPGRRAAAAMTDLAKEMLTYEKARFGAWCSTVDSAVTEGLQQPLLAWQAEQAPDSCLSGPAATEPSGGAPASQHGEGSSGRGAPRQAAINFPPALLRLMREAKYLSQLGLSVPPLAVNLALQEGQIRDHFQQLGTMLERHAAASASVRSTARALLSEQLTALDAALEPGLSRLNWTSLTIPEFVAVVNKAVDQFNALVAQVQKNTVLIERAIHHISRARLFPPETPTLCVSTDRGAAGSAGRASTEPASGVQQPGQVSPSTPGGTGLVATEGVAQAKPGGAEGAEGDQLQDSAAGVAEATAAEAPANAPAPPDVPDLLEFYEEFEQHRHQVVDGLVMRYRSVAPLLVKVEELVAGTASGKSPRLAGYYAYWERRLFSAVCGMVVGSLQALHDRLRACRPHGAGLPHGEDAEVAGSAKLPLFRVALSLLPPEVVVTPSSAEVGRQLGRLLRNVVESSKPFVRWMDGTCIEAPEQFVYGEDAEPFVFSFFSDVSQSPAVIKAMLAAQQEAQRALTGLGKAAERWRGFGVLWKTDRAAALAKFKARKPGWAAAEEKLAQYHRIGEDAWAAGVNQDVHFVRVRCAPLAAAVRAEAQAWVRGIAGVMVEADAAQLEGLRHQAGALLAAVQQQPEDEESVGRILQAAAEAEASAPGAAATCAQLAERCRARWAYVVPLDEATINADLAAVEEVATAWGILAAAAAASRSGGAHLSATESQSSLAASEAAAASAEDLRGSRRRGSVRPGAARSSMLQRSASSGSTASSASSRAKGREQRAQPAPPRRQAS